jgi:hypothetical protein
MAAILEGIDLTHACRQRRYCLAPAAHPQEGEKIA